MATEPLNTEPDDQPDSAGNDAASARGESRAGKGSGNYAADWISERPRVHAGPDHRRGGGFGGPQDSESRGEIDDEAVVISGAMPGEVPGARVASARAGGTGTPSGPGDAPMPGATAYRGVCPKDSSDIDARLRERVCETLREDARVDASGITVDVRAGELSLEGEVPSREMKERVDELISRCGMLRIHNRVRIAYSGPTTDAKDRV